MSKTPKQPRKRRLSKAQALWLIGGLLPLLLVSYWWLIWQSPWLYQPPVDLPALDDRETHLVFAYGTLKSPLVRFIVTGRISSGEAARLEGFERQALDVIPSEGSSTEGVVFEATPGELRRLDRYERIGIRYERREHPLDTGQTAWVYHLLLEEP